MPDPCGRRKDYYPRGAGNQSLSPPPIARNRSPRKLAQAGLTWEERSEGSRGLRGQKLARPIARSCRAGRGDRHHPARQGGRAPRAAAAGIRPGGGAGGRPAPPRARRAAAARAVRLVRMEKLAGRRAPVSLVLDSSVTLAWICADEITEEIRRIFDIVAESGAFVLTLWRLEVANSLTVAVRRRRIDREFRDAALGDLALLDIRTDGHTEGRAWTATLRLADR